MKRRTSWLKAIVATGVLASKASATPEFVEHVTGNQVFGEAAGVTMREPPVPREDEPLEVWLLIGNQFFYTHVAVYYTTDGSTPSGAFGTPAGTTAVLTGPGGGVNFVRNQNAGAVLDWWKATLPASTRTYRTTIKYKISAWHSGGGAEVFANNYGCSDGTCDNPAAPATVFQYTVKLAWPGKGAPYPDHALGYPPVSFWKEEGVVGNNYMNVMLDQNGTVYDIYYPSAGCVQGMGTKNEGYVDGIDTFPPGLPLGHRGQMNINQAMAGLRVGGVTYWLSNESASGYSNVSQQYLGGSNVIQSSATLTAAGRNIAVQQYDFCPKGVIFPNDDGGNPNRGLYIKRYILTNHGPSAETVNFYYYADYALNGGDGYDVVETDEQHGAMLAYDRTRRFTSASGEYNPTTTGDYDKNVSVYLATAIKLLISVGGANGSLGTEFWNHTSADTDRGWTGFRLTLEPGVAREIDAAFVGGFDDFAGATGTYEYQMTNALDWFRVQNMAAVQAATEAYWQNWLTGGVTVDTPDDDWDDLFHRGLLTTALHVDEANGGVVAGMHNGAYPFVWPRDAAYAAVTLARTGHTAESEGVYEFLRDTCFRQTQIFDTGFFGKGFWYQKYTTDGYHVWSAPQVDETAVVPWGLYYHYLVTGEPAVLSSYYTTIKEAALSSSEDSDIDTRLYYNDPTKLMHSNNVWEDSFDTFLYSNANVERGLRDAAAVATILGEPGDAALFTGRANDIHQGLIGRLTADIENTDISQLGLVYPFKVFSPTDPLVAHVVDRMNGVAGGPLCGFCPLVNFDNTYGWLDLIDRYWGDTYWGPGSSPWGAGPWFLTTAWYGLYYAERADFTPGKSDIDNHKYRMDLLIDKLGPLGLGAEQIAPSCGPGCGSLLYPNQTDFVLQTAWPNAWESHSTFVDAVMAFLDYRPDAPGNVLRIEPKLPTAWSTMTFNNLRVGSRRINVTCSESPTVNTHALTNGTGGAVGFQTVVRVPSDTTVFAVTQGGDPSAYIHEGTLGRVHVGGDITATAGGTTEVRVYFGTRGDGDGDGDIDLADWVRFPPCMTGSANGPPAPECAVFDFAPDADVDLADYAAFQSSMGN